MIENIHVEICFGELEIKNEEHWELKAHNDHL